MAAREEKKNKTKKKNKNKNTLVSKNWRKDHAKASLGFVFCQNKIVYEAQDKFGSSIGVVIVCRI